MPSLDIFPKGYPFGNSPGWPSVDNSLKPQTNTGRIWELGIRTVHPRAMVLIGTKPNKLLVLFAISEFLQIWFKMSSFSEPGILQRAIRETSIVGWMTGWILQLSRMISQVSMSHHMSTSSTEWVDWSSRPS